MLRNPFKHLSPERREQNIRALASEEYDLCIIGGGITGAGTARDAASRGMKVCLIEQNDFASGTSSRSSKLIHGGIRYLENLEFGLVFEALNERNVLFEIAPHLVHPLTFMLPVYEGDRVGMFKLGLGMWAYDALALMHAPKLHEKLSAEGAVDRVGILRRSGLEGAYLYSDAYMDDDRLVIETLRSADRFGGTFANYVKAGRGQFDEKGRLNAIEAHDQKSNRSFTIRAKHFVSTVGPWTDQFASSLFEWKKILRPSKGIHLTFRRERIPIHEAIVMATGSDKRIIFAIPRHEMVIIGTTDTDYSLSPETVHSERSDVDYLLKIVAHYFPNAGITESDIVASYAGVRPLVNDGSMTESKTSREHVIIHDPRNVTFVAGGKYTTYRRMARDIVEKVLASEFSLEDRIKFARNQTREAINPLVTREKLSEAVSAAPTWAAGCGLTAPEMELLAERHGFEALDVVEHAKKHGLHTPWEMEALFAINHTMCLHLRDFMLRRSPLFLAYRDHGLSQIDSIADVFVKAQGWDSARVAQEKQMFMDHLNFELGWRRP